MVRRAVVLILMILAGTLIAPAAAQAATAGAAPFFVVYGSGIGTSIGRGSPTRVPIGVQAWGSTPITNAVVTLDASAISARVRVVGADGPCTFTSTKITCKFGTVSKSKKTAYAIFQAVADAPAGRAGTVKLHLTGSPTPTDPNATGSITIAGEADVADMAISSTTPRGDVGQVVTVTTTIRNNGPGVQPWIVLSASRMPPGMSYAGGSGCVKAGTSFSCRKENMAVGSTATVKLSLRIDRCDKGYALGYEGPGESTSTALSDQNQYNNNFRLKITVNGCYASGSSGSSGSTTSRTSPSRSPSSAPSSTPSASPSVSPTLSPSATADGALVVASADETDPPLVEASADEPNDHDGFVVGGLAVFAVLIAGTLLVLSRRRGPAEEAR
ncbi:hypothetical protein HDA40_002790 [Hamadaea flava]|uniref:DUF11 domain-containing protein n=1 Tax=Hamadaea flava TaxID=1742688 RepID=A0ABV8LHE4_9ACTN|nr:hypothetical protein [Hamadaea flava]MCP2324283.1 hypothetical protein [Hamadaea flava]